MSLGSRRNLIALGAVAVCAAALIVAVQMFSPWRAQHGFVGQLRGTPYSSEHNAESVALVDQDGHEAPFIDKRFAATFVFFGYTHCKDACPLALATLAKAYRALGEPRRIRVEMVTVDPARDDPAAMRRFVRLFDPHFVGLTGSETVLAPIWSAFDVGVDARTRDIVHGEAIYLVDRNGRAVTLYLADAAPSDLAHDARIVAGG